MFGTWTGARSVAACPVAPWPRRIGVAWSASTTSSSIRWLARDETLACFIVLINDAAIGSGELDGVANDSAEHGLEIKSGADRLTHFAQGFQFSDRSRQFARPRFQFLKQPHVLDRYHRLVGEGLQQLDLRRGEGAHLGATRDQCSDNSPC